MVCVYTKSKSS